MSGHSNKHRNRKKIKSQGKLQNDDSSGQSQQQRSLLPFQLDISGYFDGQWEERRLVELDRFQTQYADRIVVTLGPREKENTEAVRIIIEQNPHSKELGGYIWNTSFIVSCFLANNPGFLGRAAANGVLVELGAGVGYLGIAIAKLGLVRKVVMTDLGGVMDTLRRNVELNVGDTKRIKEDISDNSNSSGSEISAVDLTWGTGNAEKFLEDRLNFIRPSFVIACDCIYSEASGIDLLSTLEVLAGKNRNENENGIKSKVLIASEVRNEEPRRIFFQAAKEAGWSVQRLERVRGGGGREGGGGNENENGGGGWWEFVPENMRIDYVEFDLLEKK